MWKPGLVIYIQVLLLGCTSGLAPNGTSWEEYHAAKYRFKVTYTDTEVADCQKLGFVRGSYYGDQAEAKEDAIEKALLLGGDTLVFENLWTDYWPFRPFLDREVHYAEGSVYRCNE